MELLIDHLKIRKRTHFLHLQRKRLLLLHQRRSLLPRRRWRTMRRPWLMLRTLTRHSSHKLKKRRSQRRGRRGARWGGAGRRGAWRRARRVAFQVRPRSLSGTNKKTTTDASAASVSAQYFVVLNNTKTPALGTDLGPGEEGRIYRRQRRNDARIKY